MDSDSGTASAWEHSRDHILFVLDESGGMPQAIMTTAEAVLATGRECKVVQSGNPTHLEGPLQEPNCRLGIPVTPISMGVTQDGIRQRTGRGTPLGRHFGREGLTCWSRPGPVC